MILLRMFFDFGVEVLEGFEAWFLQSFFTSESWSPKCLRRAFIYRSLEVGERHMAESDWWHMSQPDWSAYVIAYTCWTVCVIAYTCWCVIGFCMTHVLDCLCHRLHVLDCLCHRLHALMCDWFLHDTWQISVGFGIVIAKPSSNTWCFVIGCILWTW